MPARTASDSARSRCASARASGEVIHWLVPSAAAERPSRVAANFQVTCGRPRRRAVSHSALTRSARSASRPVSTWIPASLSVPAPPAAAGLGSGTATTTRRTPASSSAWEQGPVLPVWSQGSSVT